MGIYADLQREKAGQTETPPEWVIRLEEQRPPTIPTIILGVLMTVFLLFPLFLLILFSLDGFHPKYILSYLLLSLPGLFFGRLFLWNRYGAELLKITHEGVCLLNDYRLFQGKRGFLEGRTIHYFYLESTSSTTGATSEDVLDSLSPEKTKKVQLVIFNAHKSQLIPNYATTIENWEILLKEANDPSGRLARLVPGEVETTDDLQVENPQQ